MRVLLVADDCNPEWPSLPVVGYNLARALSLQCDVTLATQIRNKPNIEKHGIGRAAVTYIDNEYVARPMYKLGELLRGGRSVGWTTHIAITYPSYIAFEREIYKRFKPQLTSGGFDVVHRLTPMSPTIPSPLAAWSPVPFVLGPLNGGLRWPPEFAGERRREREWLTYVKAVYKVLPYSRSTYKRSAKILAAFKHTRDELPPRCYDRLIDFPEVGIDPALFSGPTKQLREGAGDGRVTFLFAGRLVPYKCADIAVQAMASRPELRQHRLIVVGDGPEMPNLQAIIEREKLHHCVNCVGSKTQAEVGQAMRQADVLAFPSIRELGAGVVVEAMACGLCCIVVDYGGPGGLIDATNGVKVPLGTRAELVEQFADKMVELARDPARRAALGRRAQSDALEKYAWDAKANAIVGIYRDIIGERQP